MLRWIQWAMVATLASGCLADRVATADLKAAVADANVALADEVFGDGFKLVDASTTDATKVQGDAESRRLNDAAGEPLDVAASMDVASGIDSDNPIDIADGLDDGDTEDTGLSIDVPGDSGWSADTLEPADTIPGDTAADGTTNLDAGQNKCTSAADCKSAIPASSLGACEKVACLGGKCGKAEINAGPCNDGNACTLGDNCLVGTCIPGVQTQQCDDKNLCTDDKCDGKIGCVFTNKSDDVQCDLAGKKVCKAGLCVDPSPQVCAAPATKCKDAATKLTCALDGKSWQEDDCTAKATGCQVGSCAKGTCGLVDGVGKGVMNIQPVRSVALADSTYVWISKGAFVRTDASGVELNSAKASGIYVSGDPYTYSVYDAGVRYIDNDTIRDVDFDGKLKSYLSLEWPSGFSSCYLRSAALMPWGETIAAGYCLKPNNYSPKIFRYTKQGKLAGEIALSCGPQQVPLIEWNAGQKETLVAIVGCSTDALNRHAHIVRLSEKGGVILQATVNLGGSGIGDGAAVRLPGGDVLIAGRRYYAISGGMATAHFLLGRATNTGKILWKTQFGSAVTGLEFLGGLWVQANTVFSVSYPSGTASGSPESWRLTRIGLDGLNLTSMLNPWVNKSNNYYKGAAVPTATGALVAAWSSNGPTDLYRTDDWGNSSCAASGACIKTPIGTCSGTQWCSGGNCK